ncbi:polynucleotide kinase [Vibrio phage 159E36-2a]
MIIFNLDGTLRNTSGSEHLVPDDITVARNWIPWQHYTNEHGTVIRNIAELYSSIDSTVYILTSSSFGTTDWLKRNGILEPDYLIERDLDDNRSPFEYTKAFIDDNYHQIELWVDDSTEVCDYAESLDIPVVRVSHG